MRSLYWAAPGLLVLGVVFLGCEQKEFKDTKPNQVVFQVKGIS
jgi:hypothetical protein